jgi:hypothetical protein
LTRRRRTRHTKPMVEATPSSWHERCEHCGGEFAADEPRWIEGRRYTVHTECAKWELWDAPPYAWKLKELRKQYRQAPPEERARIVHAGKAIRRMQAEWPKHAESHVRSVREAMRQLGS